MGAGWVCRELVGEGADEADTTMDRVLLETQVSLGVDESLQVLLRVAGKRLTVLGNC